MPFYIIMRRHIRKSVLSRYGVVMENRFVISVKHRFITSPVQKSPKYALELSIFFFIILGEFPDPLGRKLEKLLCHYVRN